MSNWSGGGKRGAGKGWQKKDKAPGAPAPQWQTKSSVQAKYGGRRRKSIWVLYSLLGVILIGLFLYAILYSPERTPMVLVLGTRYSAPVPPNQWIYEDRDAFKELGTNLDVFEVAGNWIGAGSDGSKQFSDQIEPHANADRGLLQARQAPEALVIYFSMPGVVNNQGQPCLLPPGASPFESKDWLPIESILGMIGKAAPERPKLLIFDSNQELVNWDMGIVYNTFTERLKQLINDKTKCNVANLAVMTAADEGQASWSCPQLGGTAFGQFLRLGFAGAADHDGDDEVSLDELTKYLQTEVQNWAQLNRNSMQRPVLIKTAPKLDFLVTHALSKSTIDSYREALADGAESQPSVSVDEIVELWAMFDQLKKYELVRYDPIAMGEYEDELLRVERLAYGGKAYIEEADELHKSLGDRIGEALRNAKNDSPALNDHWSVTKKIGTGLPQLASDLGSLPLRLYFGQDDQSDGAHVQEFLDKLIAAVKGGKVEPSQSDTALIQSSFLLPETQIVLAANQQRVNRYGDSSGYLDKILKLKARAEQLAVPSQLSGKDNGQNQPGDERAHYYVRLALHDADQKRRQAEDALFIVETGSERQDLISKANDSYDLAEKLQNQATASLRICDTAWAQSPYLAEWLCHSWPDNADSRKKKDSDVEDFIKLIRKNHDLGEAIGGLKNLRLGKNDGKKILDEISPAAQSVNEDLQQYLEQFSSQCEKLARPGSESDGKGMLAFEAALSAPLINSDLRKKLLEQRHELGSELRRKQFRSKGQSPASDPVDDGLAQTVNQSEDDLTNSSSPLAQAIAEWSESPLIAILDPSTSTVRSSSAGDTLDLLDEKCKKARERLSSLKELSSSGSSTEAPGENKNSALFDRSLLSDAESRVRAAAPLWFERPEKDPISQLRLFDLQQLLLWHAQRTLDDFWDTAAPRNANSIAELLAPPVNSLQAAQVPTFAETANNYLQCAEKLFDAPDAVSFEINSLRELRDKRLEAARKGIRLGAESWPVVGSKNDIDVNVNVQPTDDGVNLPIGEASVYVANEGNRFDNVSSTDANWGKISLPVKQARPQAAEARGVTSSSLDAVVFFRGRQYRQPFEVNNLDGALIRYVYPQYNQQSVNLHGDQPPPPSVVFVLDCSYSMERTFIPEGGGEPIAQMQIAKTALQTMLDELAKRQTSLPRVGVLFFGHRVAWNTTTGEIQRNRLAADPEKGISPDLPPAEDVEEILPIGILDGRALGKVRTRLRNVTYNGLTPVNLSIVRALDLFKYEEDYYPKSIIVITDGKNDQWHKTSSGFRSIIPTSTDAVIDAWKRQGKKIPVYVIAFRLQADEADEAVKDFNKIVDVTGGDVFEANSGADLIDYLRDQLKVFGYSVDALVGGRPTPITRDEFTKKEELVALNTQVGVSSTEFPLPTDVNIKYKSTAKQVWLEGGESLELDVTPTDDDIGPRPYTEGVIEQALLENGDSQTLKNLQLNVHRPKRIGTQVDFRFSVQDQEFHYTPRPKEIWVEVAPQGSQNPYLFYDAVYDADTPVPVVQFSANWPETSKEAVVTFWCGYEPTNPVYSKRLEDIKDLESLQPVFFEPIKGVKVHIGLQSLPRNEHIVLVDEKYVKGSPLGAIRVGLNSPDQTLHPHSVSHMFDAGNGIARHQFTFKGNLNKEELCQAVSVEITEASAIKQNSYRIADPKGLKFIVPNEDSMHDPSAANSASF